MCIGLLVQGEKLTTVDFHDAYEKAGACLVSSVLSLQSWMITAYFVRLKAKAISYTWYFSQVFF